MDFIGTSYSFVIGGTFQAASYRTTAPPSSSSSSSTKYSTICLRVRQRQPGLTDAESFGPHEDLLHGLSGPNQKADQRSCGRFCALMKYPRRLRIRHVAATGNRKRTTDYIFMRINLMKEKQQKSLQFLANLQRWRSRKRLAPLQIPPRRIIKY